MTGNKRAPKRRQRRGGILFMVIACLVVVTAMVGLLARDALAARKETRVRLQMMQTERLLDAGILRATLQSRDAPDYTGETWTPSLAADSLPASVEITRQDNQLTVTARLGSVPYATTKSHTYSLSQDK